MLKLFSGSANPKLSQEVAKLLNIPLSRSEVVRFDEFVELMKKSVTKPFRVKNELEKIFSWKKYVKDLERTFELA